MKAKRSLSLMLSLTLAVSLAAPAFAAEEAPATEEVAPEEIQEIVQTDDLTPPMPPLPAEVVEVLPEEGADEPLTWRNLWYYDIYSEALEEFKATHQEEYETFDADAWFQESYGGYWTKEEYMEAYGEDEEGFKDDMWSEYVSGQIDGVDEIYNAQLVALYEEAFPGELEGLSTQELLAQAGYRDPEEAYKEDHDLEGEEAVRESLLAGYIEYRREAADRHDQVEAYRTEDPESWENFDADAYFAEEWSYWTKEEFMSGWRNLRTEEDFKEALYIEYMENQSWNPNWWEDRDYPLTLVVNGFDYGAELTAEDGVTYAAPEVVNAILGTHYTEERVPLRTAAVEEGWDVVWNQYTNEVVLLDRELLLQGIYVDDESLATVDDMDQWGYEGMGQNMLALMGELEGNVIRQDFSKFDEMMTRMLSTVEQEPGQSYRTTETVDVTLTAFNSLDGDREYTFSVKADAVTRDQVTDVTLTLNAVELLDLLGQPALDRLAADMPKFTYQNLKSLLTGCKAEFIWDGGEGKLYWNVPLLALFDDSVSEDTWFALQLSDLEQEEEAVALVENAMTAKEWDTAALLYEILLDSCESDVWGATSAYSSYAVARAGANLLVGGDAITRQGGTLTWSLNAQRIDDLLSVVDPFGENVRMEELFQELDVTVSVDRNGKQTASAVVRPDMEAIAAAVVRDSWYYDPEDVVLVTWVMDLLDFRMAARSEGTANRSTGTAEFHWKNQFKLELDTGSNRRAVREEPRSTPPAGAEIVEL